MTDLPTNQIICGDNREVMSGWPADCIDAVVTDPPYGLDFMGKDWDHGVPGEAFWIEALRVAKPGAHLVAFGGTRTYHRLTCAIEDAGWEIRDCLNWLYGQGFPKSLDIGKAIDKAAGAKREKVQPGNDPGYQRNIGNIRPWMEDPEHKIDGPEPITDAAKQWDGWGSCLKPAWEPIILARKPLQGTVANNVLTHSVGGLNIDACRLDSAADSFEDNREDKVQQNSYGKYGTADYDGSRGRWPANVVLDEKVAEMLEEPARYFYTAKASRAERNNELGNTCKVTFNNKANMGETSCKDVNMVLVQLLKKVTSESTMQWLIGESGKSIMGLCQVDSLSITLMRINKITESKILDLLTHLLTSEYTADVNSEMVNGGSRAESVNESKESLQITMKENQAGLVRGVKAVVSSLLLTIKDREGWKKLTNTHSTVKPVSLMRWLVRMICPHGGVVLDPFNGSGSTTYAAREEYCKYIGIELDKEHCETAERRLSQQLLPLFEQ